MNTKWIDEYNDRQRKTGEMRLLSKQQTLSNQRCFLCGSKFHKGYKCISYVEYKCSCGKTILNKTGFKYNG